MLTYPSEKGQDSSHYQELTPISLGETLECNIRFSELLEHCQSCG